MSFVTANNATSNLAANLGNLVTDTALVIKAADVAKFPAINPGGTGADYGLATLEDVALNREIVKITRHDAGSTAMTVVRGWEGTTRRAWLIGDSVSMRLTAAIVQEALAHPAQSNGAHAATAISVAPVGNIAATNVQAALAELDSEKVATTAVIDTAHGGTGGTTGAEAQVNLGVRTSATGSTILATGTTAQQDSSPLFGFLRGNTTLSQLESWITGAWRKVFTSADPVVLTNTANVFTAQQTPARATATSTAGAAYAWAVGAAQVLELTFGAGNITALTATGAVVGTSYRLRLKQDATGGRTAAWSGFLFPGGAAPTLSTGANAVDIFDFYYNGTTMECTGQNIGEA